MRKDLLLAAEQKFMSVYPGGFNNPEMIEVGKKHKLDKMHDTVHEMFSDDQFGFVEVTAENMVKVISRSSMISVFEKPKFRDYVRSMDVDTKTRLVHGLHERLYGDSEKGFNQMLDVLVEGKMGKWSLMTIIPFYFAPSEEAFCKPTTVKNIVKTFELEGLVYKPRPSYDFYVGFRKALKEMQTYVDESFTQNYAAFTGFLMMAMNL